MFRLSCIWCILFCFLGDLCVGCMNVIGKGGIPFYRHCLEFASGCSFFRWVIGSGSAASLSIEWGDSATGPHAQMYSALYVCALCLVLRGVEFGGRWSRGDGIGGEQ